MAWICGRYVNGLNIADHRKNVQSTRWRRVVRKIRYAMERILFQISLLNSTTVNNFFIIITGLTKLQKRLPSCESPNIYLYSATFGGSKLELLSLQHPGIFIIVACVGDVALNFDCPSLSNC